MMLNPDVRSTEFLTTRWSVVLNARQPDSPLASAAMEQLCRGYWYPLYAFVRRNGHASEEARDLTQEFFFKLLEKHYLDSVDQAKGKFRSFLLAAMKHFLANQRVRDSRQKRGGGYALVPFDLVEAEQAYQCEQPHETSYDRQWAAALMERAFERLREENANPTKKKQFEALRVYLGREAKDDEYEQLAEQFGMRTSSVAVAVHRLRHRYGEIVRDEVANTVATPRDVDEEMTYLLQVLRSS